ncbi:MAG: YIP1 family protein [Candidatus Alcyoniella australis]|nr:YIP1 family protein [Candidatus Alcyoniella australis]
MGQEIVKCPNCGEQINAGLTFGGEGQYRCPKCWSEFSAAAEPSPIDRPLKAQDDRPIDAPQPGPGDAADGMQWMQEMDDYSSFSHPREELQLHQHRNVSCPLCSAQVGVDEPEVYRCRSCGGEFRYPQMEPLDSLRPGQRAAVMAQYVDLGRAGAVGDDSESVVVEDPESLGFFAWLMRSFGSLIFSPVTFFRYLEPAGSLGKALAFGVIWGVLGMLAGLGLIKYGVTPIPQGSEQFFANSNYLSIAMFCSPGILFLALLLGAALFHVGLLVLGAAGNGFKATLRAYCYASGVQLFQAIPVVGTLAGIWILVLTVIGIKEMHGTSYGRAVAGVLLPLIVLCGCGALFGISMLTSLMGRGLGG